MDLITDHIWQWLTLLILLGCSGFFSGSETALFSLSRHQLHTMRLGRSRTSRLAADLMGDPHRLLMTLLIGNNTVNVLLFATSYLLLRTLAADLGPAAISVGGALSLLTVVVFGEVVPKVIASAGAGTIGPLVAPVVHVFQILISPVRVVMESFFIVPLMRLIGRPAIGAGHVTADELKTLLEMSRHGGGIEPGESAWLQQVVDLAEARVREVMVPRVDVKAYDVAGSAADLVALFRQAHLMKMPVYEGDIDHVIGLVHARDVLLAPDRPLRDHVRSAQFVPEQMRLEQLLTHFRNTHSQLAIVVDEYGGVSGLVTLEDVLEHIVGEIRDEELPAARPDVEQLEDGTFSVAGRLSVRALARAFSPTVTDERVDTIAGLVVAHFGRIPAVGDQMRIGNLIIKVETLIGRRIDRLRLRLEDAAANGSAR